jgi:aryl-alcohol dehydrogenase-like predicted oxidoreductase
MRYKLLGNSGLRVSEMSLGTMTFGNDWGWGAELNECAKMLEAFVEVGGNFIDTSNNYTNGSSEKILGELTKTDRDSFVLATKYTLTDRPTDPNFGGNHRKNLMRSVKNSLARLQTDHIDLLWLHMWDFSTPLDEIMRALDDLVKAGTVHYLGFSDTPAWVISQAEMLAQWRGWSRVAAVQLNYNLANRDAERDLIPMAQTLGLSITPWGLLGGGALTGKFTHENADSKRNDRPSAKGQPIADALMQLATELGKSPSQVAINWVRQQSKNMIPILGARTLSQLKDNLGSLEFTLSESELTQLSAASPIDLGFPHHFLASDHIHNLIYGETYHSIDHRRQP